MSIPNVDMHFEVSDDVDDELRRFRSLGSVMRMRARLRMRGGFMCDAQQKMMIQ